MRFHVTSETKLLAHEKNKIHSENNIDDHDDRVF